jgi:glucose/mannose-6-phosphate isomerase
VISVFAAGNLFAGGDMRDLDNLAVIKKFDEGNMGDLLLGFPQHCRDAYSLAGEFALPEEYRQAKNVVIAGMGGSAIGGDLLKSLFSNTSSVPIIVNRNYTIPQFVNEDTLFIAVSYSGNTEETLSGFKKALEKKAMVMSISSGGGELEAVSEETRVPHFTIPLKDVQPRCAFGYLFIPTVVLLSRLYLIPDAAYEIDGAVKLLDSTALRLAPNVRVKDNRAKQIAKAVYNKLPVIYASETYFGVVAMRWKGQFNENSKMMAFHNLIPEMNHNEIVGWGKPEKITRQCVAIFLSDDADLEKIQSRMDITRDLIAEERVKIIDVPSCGFTPLARALYLIYIGDFTSYYAAVLNGVDPTPIKRIDLFKERLGA